MRADYVKDNEYLNPFKLNKLIYRIIGFSIWETGTRYYIYSLFARINVFSLVFFEVLDLVRNYNNFEKLVTNVNTTLIHLLALYRHYVLYSRRHQFRALTSSIESYAFRQDAAFGRDVMTTARRRNDVMVKAFAVLSAMTLATWFVFPALNWEENPYGFPMPMWVPYIERLPVQFYYSTYLWVCVTVLYISYLVISNDLLIGSLLNYQSAQYKVLAESFERIARENRSENGENSDDGDRLKNAVKIHVEEHVKILEASKTLRGLISSSMLTQLLSSTLLICMAAYLTTQTSGGNFLQTVTMAQYLGVTLTELMIACGWGNEVTSQSASVARAAYFTEWYEMTSLPERKSLRLVIMRAQRPVIMTAGNIYNLSHESFLALIKVSYSFLTLLTRTT